MTSWTASSIRAARCIWTATWSPTGVDATLLPPASTALTCDGTRLPRGVLTEQAERVTPVHCGDQAAAARIGSAVLHCSAHQPASADGVPTLVRNAAAH